MSEIRLVYVTAASREEAEKIALAVVKERLAACANILGPVHSIYHWEGKLEQNDEVVIVLKTPQVLEGRLTARILELHSYEVPAIVALPVLGGNPAFLDWVRAETLSNR